MNTMFDFAPLWRSGIGFDHLFDVLGKAAKFDEAQNYPPYNIEKTGEDAYRVTLAVAGWNPAELSVVAQPNLLIVSGNKAANAGGEYLYQGIPALTFERRFNLAEHVKVSGARLENGPLIIDLVREVPEEMKPRRIEIGGGPRPAAIEQQKAA